MPIKFGPQNTPINLDQELEALVTQENREGFLPNESLFEDRFAAAEARILGGLGVSLEQYRAGQASRGVFSSGEATAAEFRDVRAPAVRELGEVRANLSLGFETLRLQQQNFLQQQKTQAVQLALEKFLGEEAAKAAREASIFGAVGGAIGTGGGYLATR